VFGYEQFDASEAAAEDDFRAAGAEFRLVKKDVQRAEVAAQADGFESIGA
jgi:hypothetical protein